jgi:2-isopropylmalate synthase
MQQTVSAQGVALTVQFDGREIQGQGIGPIEASVNGLNANSETRVRVLGAIGTGANAQAIAYLELRIDEQYTVFGVGMNSSIVSASLKAIISGVQRAMKRRASSKISG